MPVVKDYLNHMMRLELGLYEQLINKLLSNKLQSVEEDRFFIKTTVLDKEEASRYLSLYLSETIQFALNEIKGDDRQLKQIELTNKIIQLLISELPNVELSSNILEDEGKILQAVFSKLESPYADLGKRICRHYARSYSVNKFKGMAENIEEFSPVIIPGYKIRG